MVQGFVLADGFPAYKNMRPRVVLISIQWGWGPLFHDFKTNTVSKSVRVQCGANSRKH